MIKQRHGTQHKHYKGPPMSGCSADPAQAQDDSALYQEKKRRRHTARRANHASHLFSHNEPAGYL